VREAAGERFARLELALFVFAMAVIDWRPEAAEHVALAFGLTPEQAPVAPDYLIGSVQQIAGRLHFVRFGPVVARLAGASRAGPSRAKDAACPIAADRDRSCAVRLFPQVGPFERH